MRIDIIYGTRPEFIKLAMLIHKLREYGQEVRVISTGQHKEMLKGLEEWFNITPDITLEVMREGQSIAQLSAALLGELSCLYSEEKPHWVVVQGDTQTAFVGAQAAFYHGIKIAHVEAGLRTYDKRAPFPEEINRQMISKLADLHFCPAVSSSQNLLEEKVQEHLIEVVGNTVLDALEYSREKIKAENLFPLELERYFSGEKQTSRMVLITTHRRENFGEGLEQICKAILHLAAANLEVDFLVLLHPNPQVKKTLLDYLENKFPNVDLISPLTYSDFLALLQRSYFLLTDSGGLQEEAPSFGKPVLLLRELTERPEGVVAGCVKVVGTSLENIVSEAQKLLDSEADYKAMQVDRNPFGDGKSAQFIVNRLIHEG
ncbi:non-hydrolyzing UDP-N-acetylglucosamine 2-epimerase [Mongoliitalea lutea]|uniref:UDP-N-acetylglucosamine 2-epimerase (non-hydrolyzing) n=1 Tax=Mongoliitalea lutea TaxID=849756 RepID=A0A8J3G3J4_9BACT|nr:UDP-N-acetylglucosamine 2-epimerase (non-hydrolyzing) [Mongoliitalea lutea]GHB23790.1 UDP-N-acetyl glucosamine 2-epimerase [Mongoliitalea lutea]